MCSVVEEYAGYVDLAEFSLVLGGVPHDEAKQPIPEYDDELTTLVSDLPDPIKGLLQRADINGDRSAAAWAAFKMLVETK